MPVSKVGTENFAQFGLILTKKRKSSFVLSKGKAPAKSRKLCGQQCWLYTLAPFRFYGQNNQQQSNLEWKWQSKQLHSTNADCGSSPSLGMPTAFLKVHQRGDVRCDVTPGAPAPQDRRFSKTGYAVLATFSDM